MRKITKIIIHCSDSDILVHDSIEVIKHWHMQRDFNDVGYHYFIKKNGEIQKGRELKKVGAHTKGHNDDSIGICLSGRHEFTQEQFDSLRRICELLIENHCLVIENIFGHSHFDKSKTCPNFDVEIFKNEIKQKETL